MTDPKLGLEPNETSKVGLFPLPNVVLFPAQLLSLHVFEPRYRKLVSDVIEQGARLAVPRLEPGHDSDYYGAPPVFPVCGVGRITEYARLPDGRFNIVVLGLGRVRILDELRSEPYRMARVEALSDRLAQPPIVAEALRAELSKLVRILDQGAGENIGALTGVRCVAQSGLEIFCGPSEMWRGAADELR